MMTSSDAVSGATRTGGPDSPAWPGLTAIVVLAVLVRSVFFTGFFGSDEVTYTLVAVEIANGHWSVPSYIGALRYGINLPNALFMKLFGVSEFSANFWSLLASVAEVGLVYFFAHRLWGFRAGLLAGMVAALLPLHVHYGGRLMADAPLAFFITLSFVLFWIGEKRQDAAFYFAAGLAAGCVFWVKQVVLIYCAVFAIYALLFRTWNHKWLWSVFGGALMLGANCLLLWWITGDPLHVFNVIRTGAGAFVDSLSEAYTSPWFYFRYMFADIKHLWLMPYLAFGGIALWALQARGTPALDKGTAYVVLWALGLLVVFSFTPVSLHPVKLISKQVNYMLIFVAPLCMLAGYFLARFSGLALAAILAVVVAGSLLLAALEQQVIHVFTANSKASVAFAQQHREIPVYAMTNAYRAGIYTAVTQGRERRENPLRDISQIAADLNGERNAKAQPAQGPVAYAIIDLQTIAWGSNPITSLDQVPGCWNRVETLSPTGLGFGKAVPAILQATVDRLPAALAEKLSRTTQPLLRPRPAYVYAIPANCRFSL